MSSCIHLPVNRHRGFTIEVDWARGAVGGRPIHNPDAVLLAQAEDVEVEVVRCLRQLHRQELFPVLVNVGVHPTPVAVVNVVKVLKAALSTEKKERNTHEIYTTTISCQLKSLQEGFSLSLNIHAKVIEEAS